MQLSVGFLLVALAVSATATPVGSLKIPLVKRRGFRGHINHHGTVNAAGLNMNVQRSIEKFQRGFAIYEANTGLAHPLASNVSTKRAAAVEPLTEDSFNGLWYGAISVGTPRVTYTVAFDTGSTDLFLPGPNCNTNCAGHKIYNPSASSTYTAIGSTFSLLYGDGSSVVGTTCSDTVAVAGLAAARQTLGVATQYSSGFSAAHFLPDGLLGLAWAQISVYRAPGYFQTLVDEGQVNSSLFGFKLAINGSELTLGKLDSTLYTGALTYVPVVLQAYWQVALDAISVNGVPVLFGLQAIIDTGTTLLIGPSADVAKFYNSIPGSAPAPQYFPGAYTIPCNATPSVSLTFGGKAFTISAATLNVMQISVHTCLAGVAASSGFNFWIVGDVFLQNVYSVFDVGASRVGFATVA